MKKLEPAQQRDLRRKAMSLEQFNFTHTTLLEQQPGGAAALKWKLERHYGMVHPALPKIGIVWMEKPNHTAKSLWDVRVSVCGYPCVIGCAQGGFSITEKMLRFADMTRLYFWKYRVRGKTEPSDADFNFSKAQAELDLLQETELKTFLDNQAKFLTSINILKLPDPAAKESRARPTDQLNSRMGSLQLDFVHLKEKQDELAVSLNDVKLELREAKQFNASLVGLLKEILFHLSFITTAQTAQRANPNQVAASPGDVLPSGS
jgi:hypothetical protein